MDQALAIAEAIAIAGFISSVAQEAFLSHLEGNAARITTVVMALAVGLFATARTGGFAAVTTATDPFGFAMAVLLSAGVALAASQAAFRVFVRPIASLPAAK